MSLILRLHSYRDQPVPDQLCVHYSEHGGTFGRAPDNALVLEDPGKYISRVHATVSFREGEFYLEDLGSNPSVVNDRPLGKGHETVLADGDTIVVGDYRLDVLLQRAQTEPEQSAFDALAHATEPVALPPFALDGAHSLDMGCNLNSADSLEDPLGINLFASAKPLASPHIDFFSATQSDHLSPELASFPLPSAQVGASHLIIPTDYNLLDDTSSATQPIEQLSIALPSAGPAAGEDSILQALLRGLGLPDLTMQDLNTQVAENIGTLLREATSGTMDVLMIRALTKKENRMDMTMMATNANNPLKFFPNVDSALTQLLSNRMTGYMQPAQAMANAFDDVRAHELSVIAGMRAALTTVLERLDPNVIERHTPSPTLIYKIGRHTAHKARMWDRMLEVYNEVTRDVEEAQGVFGGTFCTAYEAQVGRLRDSGQ